MFEAALRAYGLDRCSLNRETLIIGVGPDEPLGGPVDTLPPAPERVFFADGADQVALIEVFLASPMASHVRHLAIGSSHLVAERRGSLDFSGAVAAQKRATLPVLETLSLGDMERLFNGHRYFGGLGDIAPAFDAAPNLRTLDLHGGFSLSRLVRHARLETLSATVDDIGVTQGAPSPATVDTLLSGDFPALREIDLLLDDGDPDSADYTLPPRFFSGAAMPGLTAFSLDRLASASRGGLDGLARKKGITVCIG
ncbi:MAG: hypothetical protein AAFX39_00665 [Pseudomonadota bacterium]